MSTGSVTRGCICIPEVTLSSARGRIVVRAACPCGYGETIRVTDSATVPAQMDGAWVRAAQHDCGATTPGGCFAGAEVVHDGAVGWIAVA